MNSEGRNWILQAEKEEGQRKNEGGRRRQNSKVGGTLRMNEEVET